VKIVYRLLDTFAAGRIIKDVMRHEIGEENEVKKWRQKVESGRNLEPHNTESTDTHPDEIDPADFFDPEEFGYRRGRLHGG
jgi:hypothetical protein